MVAAGHAPALLSPSFLEEALGAGLGAGVNNDGCALARAVVRSRSVADVLAACLDALRPYLGSQAAVLRCVPVQGEVTSVPPVETMPVPAALVEYDAAWVMSVPLRDDGEVVGALQLRCAHHYPRSASCGGRLEHLADHVAPVIARLLLARQLATLRSRDALTGLASSEAFCDEVVRALSRGTGTTSSVGVAVFDIDDFRSLNIAMGPSGGDRLLSLYGTRLAMAAQPRGVAARLGGDCFAVLLLDVRDRGDATERVRGILHTLSAPVMVMARALTVTTSAGIALGTCTTAGGDGARVLAKPSDPRVRALAETLVRQASLAVVAAKRGGAGRVEVFDEGLHAEALARSELLEHLQHAIGREELALHYQPVVHIGTGEVIGFEALARWHHPARGTVGPLSFIPLAEQGGMIVAIGRWVIQEACAQLRRWQDTLPGGECVSMSINLSGRQLRDPNLIAIVEEALEDNGLDPDRVVLELTESVLVGDGQHTFEMLHRLKALGVRLAIDDFGTGYSSLSYLRRFPVDVLKIDRSFVVGLGSVTGPGATACAQEGALARAIIQMGGSLGLQVIAEGVESVNQLSHLRSLGCSLIQGYHVSPALSARAMARWYTDRMAGSSPADSASRHRPSQALSPRASILASVT